MAIADLPEGFVTFQRDEITTKILRDIKLRNPDADITSGQPVLDAALLADALLPVYSDAKLVADGINEDEATGARLDRVGERIGVPRGEAAGASGYVAVTAASGGGTIQQGDELENPHTRLRYEAALTLHRLDGEHIRVRAKSTGPGTDLGPGVVLRWTAPRPGIGANVTVVEQSGGRGLTGGADVESDPQYLERIRDRKRNPVAGDNDAEIVKVLLECPDLAIEQVFTYPAYLGSGTHAWTFTVLASELGASRIPSTTQLQAALAWLIAQMPGDHNYFPLDIVATDRDFVLSIRWSETAAGWLDNHPFPAASGVTISAATDALTFSVSGGSVAPVVGQTIAVWDKPKRAWRKKRIATVTGSGPWVLTCTTANGASDSSYTPVVGQLVSPWSESLPILVKPTLEHFASLGPGELYATVNPYEETRPEEGRRRRREPRNPSAWPSRTSDSLLSDIGALVEVDSYSTASSFTLDVDFGIPPNMWVLDDFAVYPMS